MSDSTLTEKGRRTRQAIVDAATVVFARKGLFDARVTDITEEAGVSPAAFYRYFETKGDILDEAVDNVRDEVLAAMRQPGPGGRRVEPFFRFSHANRRYLEAYRNNVSVVRMLEQRVAIDDSFRVARRDWHPAFVGRLAAGLARMQARGEIDPTVRVELTAPALSAMVENLAYVNFVLRGRSQLDDEVATAIDMLWGNVLGLDWTIDEDDEQDDAQDDAQDDTRPDEDRAGIVADDPSTPPLEEPALSRKGAATRATLLRAARSVFERQGYLDARVSDIVAVADVAHGTFYNYFDSRFDVFCVLGRALCDELLERLDDVAAPLRGVGAGPVERITDELRVVHDFWRDNVRLFAVLEQFANIDGDGARFRLGLRSQFVERITRSVSRLQAAGAADLRLRPAATAEALVSMFDRLMFEWYVLEIDADPEAGLEYLGTVWARALGVAGSAVDTGIGAAAQ